MKYALLLALAVPMFAQDRQQPSFRVSQAALMGSTLVDVLSSRGMYELNPLLGRGDFHMGRQGVRAIGISAGMILAQNVIVQRWPSTQRVFKYTNWIGAGMHFGASLQNWNAR